MITKKWWQRTATTIACCLLFLPTNPVQAENRALIVGVGEYQNAEVNDLTGIDLDVNMMLDVADLMGFSRHQIKVLRDNQATSENIEQNISSWLGEAGSDDQVLFYYSGHGSSIPDKSGDEQDGLDEVLLGHTTKVVMQNGEATLTGVLVDDRINDLLNNLRSKNVLAMLDSCHSGTGVKSFDIQSREMFFERYESKMFNYPGMRHSRSVEISPRSGDENYVHIGACRDDEQSAASTQGSIFTLGISEAVKTAAGKGWSITPRELQEKATVFIRSKADSSPEIWEYHPQINGNSRLMDKNIVMRRVDNGNGPGWKKLEKFYQQVTDKSLTLDVRQTYNIGDNFEVSVAIERPGYLCLLYVDASDEITMLYPNKHNPDGQVVPGKAWIPGPDMNFDLTVARPAGKHKLVALWSKDLMMGVESGKKTSADVFAIATEKSLNILSRKIEMNSRTSVGKAEFTVR